MKAIFVFCFCFIVSIISAQLQYKSFHFTSDDGLPCNSIYAVCEDQNGNIVLGTDNGLSVFDGNDFINFNVKDGLVNPYIVGVCSDQDGTIWLINYKGNLQKFQQNKIIDTKVFTGYNNQIFAAKNRLFLYTMQNRKVNNIFPFMAVDRKTLQTVAIQNHANPQLIAPPILNQNNEEIKLIDGHLVYKNYNITVSNDIKFIHKVIFRKNDVCVLDEKYLFIIDFSSKIINKIKLPTPLSENPIFKYDFIVDQQQNCWLNVQGQGIFVLKNNIWQSINKSLGLNPADNANFLYCDTRGRMWIATNQNGLFCIPSASAENIRFDNEENYFDGFALSQNKKSLFVATKFCLFAYHNDAFSLLQKSNAAVRIENFEGTPVTYNAQQHSPKWNQDLGLLSISGKHLIKKGKNKFYVLAGNASINVFENGSSVIQSLRLKISENEVIKQIVGYKNEYYFNNSKKIDIRSFDLDYIYKKRDLKFTIKGYIEDFVFVRDTMWIAANNAVYKVFQEKIVDSITQINDAKIDNIHKIVQIENDVFLCAGNGLFMISRNKNRVLNKYNFLPNNEVYNVTIFENKLFVATKDGLAKLDLNLIRQKTQKPKLSFFYNDFESLKIKQIEKTVAIAAAQNSFQIHFKIQNFNAVKNQMVQYHIDDSNWITITNKTISFETISYGKHSILVRAKDVNSDWETKSILVYRNYPFFLKWWFILLVVILTVILLKIVFDRVQRNKNNKLQVINSRKNKIIELRQSALSAMMNPHFVFNSLNAVQYFVNSNQKEQASEHIGKLSRLVRLFLSQAAAPYISLDDEIKRLKLYVSLEQTRFENFDFEVHLDPAIDAFKVQIPNMILQPFIENAVLHGVSYLKDNSGKIDLSFQLQQNVLTITIADNGFGLDSNKPKNDQHISKGIAIITERIEILQEFYPDNIFSVSQQNAFDDPLRKGHKVVFKITLLN